MKTEGKIETERGGVGCKAQAGPASAPPVVGRTRMTKFICILDFLKYWIIKYLIPTEKVVILPYF